MVEKQNNPEQPIQILVVDDNEMFLEAVTDILEMDGIEVVTAGDGQTGVTLFKKYCKEFSMILLDAKLPDMNGNEVVKRIRRICGDTPIVVSSGYGYQQIIEDYHFDPADLAGHLLKPFDALRLREIVQKTL